MERMKKYREFLLKAEYSLEKVAKMSDEEVISEYEAVTGDSTDVTPIY